MENYYKKRHGIARLCGTEVKKKQKLNLSQQTAWAGLGCESEAPGKNKGKAKGSCEKRSFPFPFAGCCTEKKAKGYEYFVNKENSAFPLFSFVGKLIILIVDFNKFGADKSCFSTKEPRAADYGERAKLNQVRIASQQLLRKGGKRTDERFY